jgi:hypothetical protein
MSSPFLLRVVPEAGGGSWVVREPGTGRVVARASSEDAAARRATELLPSGGLVQILNAGDFIVGRVVVPPPPEPLRTRLTLAAVSLGIAVVGGLVLGWLLGGNFVGAAVGVALGGQVPLLWRAAAARRRRDAELDDDRTPA